MGVLGGRLVAVCFLCLGGGVEESVCLPLSFLGRGQVGTKAPFELHPSYRFQAGSQGSLR